MELPPQHECTVSGPLAFVIRLSQFFGIASVSFKRDNGIWCIRVSRWAGLYGKIVILLICTIVMATISNYYGHSRDLRLQHYQSSNSTWSYFSATTVTAVLLSEVYFNFSRMERMITCLSQIQKINAELNRFGTRKSYNNTEHLMAVGTVIGAILLMTLDNYVLLHITSLNFAWLEVKAVAFYIASTIVKILNLQISLVLTAAFWSLDYLNDCLKNLLQQIWNESLDANNVVSIPDRPKVYTVAAWKSINNLIDSMANYHGVGKDPLSIKSSKSSSATLHRFGFLYCFLHDVVKELDKSYGIIIVLLIASHFMQFVVTLYNLVMEILKRQDLLCIILHFLWSTCYFFDMILLIEPCHQTNEQMKRTKRLISQFMLFIPAELHNLNSELEIFYKHLTLNEIFYSPMRMFRVNRATIITILGSATTYMVVMIQL